MLIDTQAHLWFPDYDNDLEVVIERAKQVGVEKMIVPGTDALSSKKALELATKYPEIIYGAVGVHPEELLNHKSFDLSFTALLTALRSELVGQAVAIGEIGTDASTEELKKCMDKQEELFRQQCEVAIDHDLPVIIHTRNSLTEALEVLDGLKKMPRGQFHCFSHDENGVKQVLERGFCVSFCGNITWSKRVARLVSLIPRDRLLLETDSPLMVPRNSNQEPIRGSERNEPANIVELARIIAELRGVTITEIAKVTSENAIRLFRL
jgi:TatD DNase family protein